MPISSPLPPPEQPSHVRVFADARVEGFPYSAWKVVTREEWEASTPEQRQGWRAEARSCLLSTITVEKGPTAAASARVTY